MTEATYTPMEIAEQLTLEIPHEKLARLFCVSISRLPIQDVWIIVSELQEYVNRTRCRYCIK